MTFHSFLDILDELIKSKRLAGSFTGGKASYVPDIYSKSQNDWVDAFYSQNGYLGKHIQGTTLTFVATCAVGQVRFNFHLPFSCP